MKADLEALASMFDTFASDQLASRRWQSTQKAKAECELRAAVWTDAANCVRERIAHEPPVIFTDGSKPTSSADPA